MECHSQPIRVRATLAVSAKAIVSLCVPRRSTATLCPSPTLEGMSALGPRRASSSPSLQYLRLGPSTEPCADASCCPASSCRTPTTRIQSLSEPITPITTVAYDACCHALPRLFAHFRVLADDLSDPAQPKTRMTTAVISAADVKNSPPSAVAPSSGLTECLETSSTEPLLASLPIEPRGSACPPCI